MSRDDITSYRDLLVWQQAMDRTPGYLAKVTIALGEHAELETQEIISVRRHYISEDGNRAFEALSGSVGRLTHRLARSLEARIEARH